MDYIRTLTQRSASETRVGNRRPLSTPPSRTPSRTTSPTVSPRSLPLPPSPTPPSIPNADPLPLNADTLEGLLNERSSQLQKLADRVESINEWLEMDGIVLAKLIQDIGSQADKEAEAKRAGDEAAERARALWKENNPHTPAASTAPVSPGQHRSGGGGGSSSAGSGTVSGSGGQRSRVPSGESRVPEVFLKGLNLHSGTLKGKEERVDENCSVRDLRERISAMKRWRREIERTVCWQLEEYRRVLKAINRLSDESGKRAARRVVQFQDEGDGEGKGKGKEREKEGAEPVKTTGVQRDEGWGVGGQTWERKSGRVPSQAEWEELFSEGRIGWDDKGIHRKYLGC